MKAIVIGAGAAGLSIGWRLAQAGAQVVVIERGSPGRGATWAAAGMIATAAPAPVDSEAELVSRSARLWPGFAAEIEQASGRSVSFQANGGLKVALAPGDSEALQARAARAARGEGEMIAPEAARLREPRLAPDIAGALWIEKEAKVDNRALGPALAAAFAKAGGSLLVNETVVRFECHGNRVVSVCTPFGRHEADVYVLAAGAWTARIEGLPRDAMPPIIPVKGEMLALDPPAGEALPAPAIIGNEVYLVGQRGRLFVGATVTREGFDTGTSRQAADWLLGCATALMPSLRNWARVEHWAGLRPGTPDDLPVLGRSAVDNLFIAGGQYRSGILYAPAIAEALAALVLGENAPLDLAAFDPGRFQGSNY